MKIITVCFVVLCLALLAASRPADPVSMAWHVTEREGIVELIPVGLDARLVIEIDRDQHHHEEDEHRKRELLQRQGQRNGRDCDLTEAMQERFYDASTQIWTLNSALLEELDDDVQRLVNCVGNSETVLLSRGVVVKSAAAIRIDKPISFVAEDSDEGRMPRWTCGSSDRNQIAIISDVDGVVFDGIHFLKCDASSSGSPIVLERSDVSFSNCQFENSRGDNGGIISARQSSLTLISSAFRLNRAERDGGSIFAYDRSNVKVEGCLFEDNESNNFGGSIRLLNGTSASFTDSLFLRNRAESGGAIHAASFEEFAQIELEACAFDGNQAAINGGAVALEASDYDEHHSTTHRTISVWGETIDAEEVTHQARRRMGRSPMNPDSEDPIPLIIMTVSHSVFEFNEAGDVGGAAAAMVGCLVWVEDSIFNDNKAGTLSGGVYVLQSVFFCNYCTFNNNAAGTSGGALVINGFTDGTSHGSHICEATVHHSSFVNNTCTNRGGGVLVDGLEAYFYVVNVTYHSNTARAGGGIASGNAAFLNVTSAQFVRNRADDGGGAVSLSFLQFRDTRSAFSNVMFVENEAASMGGALYSEFYLYVDSQMKQTHFGDQSLENPSIQMNHTTFLRNSALKGGAMALNGVPALLRNITMEGNKAEEAGGALALVGLSVVQVVGGRFQGNEAKSGGALMIRERCAMHCIDCAITNNKASAHGGGVCIVCNFAEMHPVVFDCDECSVKNNRARIGGGLHLNHLSVPFGTDGDQLPIVVLKNLELTDNYARVGGGGIMTSHPDHVAVQCSGQVDQPASRNLTEDLIKINEVHQMPRMSKKSCPAWRGNSVGANGYGPMRATFASTASVCIVQNDDTCSIANGQLPIHSSAGLIPPIKVTLVDQFGQSPAEPLPDNEDLILAPQSVNVRLSGQLDSHFFRGEASLTETTVTGHPGAYDLNLHFSDKRIADIHLETGLRSCSIGEQSVLQNTACQRCEAGTYSVQEPLKKCTECHRSCVCRKWGIAPKSGHWMPSPCVTQAKECLSDNACTYDGREEALDEFFDTHDPTCDQSDEDGALFRSLQCSEGHEGPLCGSCSSSYGSVGLECRKCMSRIMIVMLLLLNLSWFFILAAIAMRGNLSFKKPAELDRLKYEDPDQIDRKSIAEMYITGMVSMAASSHRLNNVSIGGTSSHRLNNLSIGGTSSHRLNNISIGGMSSRQIHRASSSKSLGQPAMTLMSECEAAKKNVAERFKLFVNFAQVNSMALIITTHWTKAAEETLTVLDFTGAVSTEAAITLDCLFSGDCSVPRSVSKTIMSLVLPFALLLILSALWTARHICNLKLLKRRLVLTLLIVLYISYIGIARRVFSVLYCIRIQDGQTLEDSTNKLYWSQDTSVVCYEGSHLILLGSLALPQIIVVLVAFPLGSAMFLFVARNNQSLDTDQLKETFGFMYQAYKEEFVFWDCTILFRKAALALVVIFGASLGENMQGLIAVCILGISFYLHMTFLPYNDTFASLNSSEKYSLIVSIMTFLSGVFVSNSSITTGGRVFCSVVVLFVNLGFMLFSALDIYIKMLRYFRLNLEEDNVPINKEEVHFKLVAMWLRHQCAELLTAWRTMKTN